MPSGLDKVLAAMAAMAAFDAFAPDTGSASRPRSEHSRKIPSAAADKLVLQLRRVLKELNSYAKLLNEYGIADMADLDEPPGVPRHDWSDAIVFEHVIGCEHLVVSADEVMAKVIEEGVPIDIFDNVTWWTRLNGRATVSETPTNGARRTERPLPPGLAEWAAGDCARRRFRQAGDYPMHPLWTPQMMIPPPA